MDYKEIAERLAALAICSEQVPIGCEKCPAYNKDLGQKQQRKACNEMLAPGKIVEAVGVVKEYQAKQQETAPGSASK